MSTPAILKAALEAGELCHLSPAFGDPIRRSLLVHRELNELFNLHGGVRQIGAMRGYLEGFVTGVRVTMGMTPYKHGAATMGRLDPISEGSWEFRCRDPNPATRVLGRFYCRDTFIALDWAPRSKSIPGIDKRPLGDTGSLEWEIALGVTHQRWNEIAGTAPLIGSCASDYLAENASEV